MQLNFDSFVPDKAILGELPMITHPSGPYISTCLISLMEGVTNIVMIGLRERPSLWWIPMFWKTWSYSTRIRKISQAVYEAALHIEVEKSPLDGKHQQQIQKRALMMRWFVNDALLKGRVVTITRSAKEVDHVDD